MGDREQKLLQASLEGLLIKLNEIKNSQERTPPLRKYATLPLILSPDKDEELLKLTENRVPSFSHDLVPDLLRTKPDPEVESKHSGFESRANSIAVDQAAKQLAVIEKITNGTLKFIAREREEMESKAHSRSEIEKKLFPSMTPFPLLQPLELEEVSNLKFSLHLCITTSLKFALLFIYLKTRLRAPLKTNIKAASQVHPYQRPT
ncbi:MED8 [Lepeophtheirus salmonis]|uniref:Mediator of RNA polymerase II transcription subunit 8 n=1 Tax=Lepeophtheirus salmonis TaxID=72036 RepID=A0A7R8CPU2_LEPSM|nr:MED8 [Lepeophtheirus salmonis]CAF2887112.1 MED8 [Lepeophtheirus salmonis]